MSRACASCGGTDLESGVLVDVIPGGARAATWLPGIPETGMLRGLKLRGRQQYAVDGYRCRQCGYLNLFATGPA